MPRRKGFTLIELLVVIAIIGLLSSIVLASLNTARAKARDAERISNVKALEVAMELYYNDHRSYPQFSTTGAGHSFVAAPGLASFLVPTDIASVPSDPQGKVLQYVWGSGGNSYGMEIYLESLGGYCKTGVNMSSGWWGKPDCNF